MATEVTTMNCWRLQEMQNVGVRLPMNKPADKATRPNTTDSPSPPTGTKPSPQRPATDGNGQTLFL